MSFVDLIGVSIWSTWNIDLYFGYFYYTEKGELNLWEAF